MIEPNDVQAVAQALKEGKSVCTRPGVLVAARAIAFDVDKTEDYDHACGECGHVSVQCNHVCEVD